MQIDKKEADNLQRFVLENAVLHVTTSSFAARSLCEGTMSSRVGMAVAMNGFAGARHAENVLSMCNPMAPQMVQLNG